MKKKPIIIEINELFLSKAEWKRTFTGTITRTQDEHNNPLIHGKIPVKYKNHDGYVYSIASEEDELGKKLDEMVIMVLGHGLHNEQGVSSILCETPFYHN